MTMRSAFPPLQPNELAKDAENFEFNPHVPLKNYVGALDALYREGRNYLRERNFAKAYLLLLRFSILFLDKVSTLPAAQTPEGRKLLRPTKKRINSVLVELENIKPDLVEARSRWEAENPQAAEPQPNAEYAEGYLDFAARDAALSWNAKAQATLLDASDYQDFAVDLATEELSRRQTTRRQASSTSRGGVWSDGDRPSLPPPPSRDDDGEMRRQMEQARRQLDRHEENSMTGWTEKGAIHRGYAPASATYHYPSIAKSAPLQYSYDASQASRDGSRDTTAAERPPRPQKDATGAVYRQNYTHLADLADLTPPVPPPRQAILAPQQPPKRPPKTAFVDSAPPPEKESFTFRPAGYLEDGKPIRPVFLPEGLRQDFVRLAAANTRKGIETCGILCGTNINNALFITCLLVPEQHGTPDTCETTDEAATFEFFEKEDLLQIGWIHTHPTQTCFMSSRDLHTQAGYQIMMDESVAIVCSPSHDPSWGVFRLTKPPGLQHLLNCSETSTFHQHSLPADALYTNAQNPPGHVFVTSRMEYWVHDMRQAATGK